MKPVTKKKLIAGLLLVSCVISGWLLVITPVNNSKSLQHLGQADSLLQRTMTDYNISEHQVSRSSTEIDSAFNRLTHTVHVPPGFSKTQFHASLQQRVAPYGVDVPARVIFPDRDMHIQFDYKNTVIRTVKLITDEDLKMQRSFASIIVAFESQPDDYLLETLQSFGEPMGAAVMLSTPLQEPDWWDDVQKQYARMMIWPRTDNGENVVKSNSSQVVSTLEPIENVMRGTDLLCFAGDKGTCITLENKLALNFVDVGSALILNDEMNKQEFDQAFRTFIEQARSGKRPKAIIMGTEQTLQWTRDNLNMYKKSGLQLIAPAN